MPKFLLFETKVISTSLGHYFLCTSNYLLICSPKWLLPPPCPRHLGGNNIRAPQTNLSTQQFAAAKLQLCNSLIIMRQVSSLKADQLELTSACFSSFRLMKPLWSVSTLWNHWYASGLTPGGMLPAEEGNKRVATRIIFWQEKGSEDFFQIKYQLSLFLQHKSLFIYRKEK